MSTTSSIRKLMPVSRPKRKKITVSQVVTEIFKYTLILFLSVTFLIPLYWMAMSALKNQAQVFVVPPVWWPNPARWLNYIEAWQIEPFTLYLYNTVFRLALPVAIGTIVSNTLVAYSFGRLRWPGRDAVFAICLMTMMIPGQVTMVPLFIIFKTLGWVNSYKPLVIPSFFASAYTIFMLRQFFRTIPEELTDAARIDGANEIQIMWHIILPLVKPALAVVALFSFMGSWNSYLGPLIYLNQSSQYTISLGLASFSATLGQVGVKGLAYPYLMAASTLVTLPIIILFFFTQRTFIEGINLTGIKG